VSGGYTPLFASLTTGTLYGRWPDIGLFPIVLALANKHGIVDVTPAYLAGVTGLPIVDVTACMQRFCEPDPFSRSTAEGGARLTLLDPERRNWGWRVVNHARYRERGRKASYDSARTESGRDADRKKRERRASRLVPTCPDVSRDVPLSDADADANGGTPPARTEGAPAAPSIGFAKFKETYPRRSGDPGWKKAQRAWDARIKEGHSDGEMIAGATRYLAYIQAKGDVGTQFVKQAATFLGPDKAFELPWDPPVHLQNGGGHAHPACAILKQLIASDGAQPPRTDQIQAAIDAAGGWQAIKLHRRNDLPRIERQFCEGYEGSSTAPHRPSMQDGAQ
jgi:hypothetical protein